MVKMSDDILVSGKDKQNTFLKSAEECQRIASIKLKPGRCIPGKTYVKFLGVTVDDRGLSLDPNKVQAILTMKELEDIGIIWQLLGLANQ